MTDQNQAMRDDIAFMRTLAEAGREGPLNGGSILVAAGLIFGAERGTERAGLLLRLLRPGTILTLTGDAVIDPTDARYPARMLV